MGYNDTHYDWTLAMFTTEAAKDLRKGDLFYINKTRCILVKPPTMSFNRESVTLTVVDLDDLYARPLDAPFPAHTKLRIIK